MGRVASKILGKLYRGDKWPRLATCGGPGGADLAQVEYEAPEHSRVDIEQRMAEVQGEAVTPTGLSPEIEKRLKQLEAEET